MGRMGITHYSIINSHPKVEITAVADTSKTTLQLLSKYIKNLSTFKNYESLLQSNLVDAILVCTPPSLNFEILKCAAKNNIHVFVEKPFSTKFSEAEKLSILFKEKGLVGQVGYVNRFNDSFIKAKELLESKIIGDVVHFKSEMFTRTVISNKNKESGWRALPQNGGGAVFEIASHAIDLINFFLGKPDNVIGTNLNSVFSSNVEDIVSTSLLYKDGTSGTLYVNWSEESYRKPAIKFEFFGNKGKIQVDQHGLKVFINNNNNVDLFRKGWNTLYSTDVYQNTPFYVRGNDFTRQLYSFADLILKEKDECVCTFEDGKHTLEVIEAMFNDYNKRKNL